MSNAGRQHGFGEAPTPPLTIDGSAGDVLPRVDRDVLCSMLRRLPPDELDAALRSKLVPMVSLPGLQLHAACGPSARAEGQRLGLKLVGYAEAHDLVAAARAVHGAFLLRRATLGLAQRMPYFSASRRLTGTQGLSLAAGSVLAAAAAFLLPVEIFWPAASLVSGAFFLSLVAVRLLCLMPPLQRDPPLREVTEFPAYSVLVPLFRETAVLKQLMGALAQLRYPEDKLDIKLILEEEDVAMQAAVARLALPPRFEIIVVPAGRPQTKPRALCYALPFCRGELLTIYDAEDVPEPDQLEKAARRFAGAGPELACLQAQLTFFNPNENWLTRQFTAEYALLFGRLLPVLADHRLPLPLGGTSNHFRTTALRAVGAWDPFNVTEDADLGLRLSRFGYETGTLDSLTYEEANTRLPNWMRQRARWLKGFLATWLVHMRDPLRLMRELGPAGFWIAQAMTIGVFASALLHPICLAATIMLAVAYPGLPEQAGLVLVAIAGLNLLVFVAGYGLGIYLTRDALRRRGIFGWHGTLATMPFYWLLMSGAAWLALWQFMVAPFHWNKTEHGLSRMQGERRLLRHLGLMQALRRGIGSVLRRVRPRIRRPEA
jgi:cellulose synthase/poly-beta-1,6-N-acetylglucosamine synthase-like glycosyltransferase